MLRAYIDDSHMGDVNSPLYVLGGWVAPAKTWASFSDAWLEVLRMRPRVGHFKFDDAMGLSGEFLGISEESRAFKLKLLMRTIEDHNLYGACIGIPHLLFTKLFSRNVNYGPQWSRSVMGFFRNPYPLAFFMMTQMLVNHYIELNSQETIEFVFDYQPRGRMPIVQAAWESFYEEVPPEWKARITAHPPSFLNDKDVIALQAADLHAGWAHKQGVAGLLGNGEVVPPWGNIGDKIERKQWMLSIEEAIAIYRDTIKLDPFYVTGAFGYGVSRNSILL
jgi:hypothetical protein